MNKGFSRSEGWRWPRRRSWRPGCRGDAYGDKVNIGIGINIGARRPLRPVVVQETALTYDTSSSATAATSTTRTCARIAGGRDPR